MNHSILIIDSDTALITLLTRYLEKDGFTVDSCSQGELALKKALNQPWLAIILDIALPSLNGFVLLKNIRAHTNVPVLMLTSRKDDIDKLMSFELGADDYLTKPCNPRELITRLHAILRRTRNIPVQKPIIELHNIRIDCPKRQAFAHEQPLELTNAEFNILEMLIKSPGQAFSKEELTEYALGRKYTAYDRSIDVHISNLRNKLGDDPNGEPLLKTVRGFGYMFENH